MAEKSLGEISEHIRDLDFAMLTTVAPDGGIASRPMSNNREVEYEGDSYYFTDDDTDMVREIRDNPSVGLTFQGDGAFFIAVAGQAELIRDKAAFEEHWTSDLDDWFEDGADTPGLVLIKIRARRVHYWDGEENGEFIL